MANSPCVYPPKHERVVRSMYANVHTGFTYTVSFVYECLRACICGTVWACVRVCRPRHVWY